MCGWVGIFGRTVCLEDLKRAGNLLNSRGPDGSGEVLFHGKPYGGLSHRRLAILDTSELGSQPMYDPKEQVTVAYNGEIYNSPSLREELISKGIRFTSRSDTEVILRGWIYWGDKILEKLEGMFSFAIVNEKTGKVLLARDRFGIKPLYWALDKDTLFAASAPRAILKLFAKARTDLDMIAIGQFLTLLWIPHPRTPWNKIKKLEPGFAISFEDGLLKKWQFTKIQNYGSSEIDLIELLHGLQNATQRQLLSDVPVGILLSGGIDSTMLLSIVANELNINKIPAVAAGYSREAQSLEITPDDLYFASLAANTYPNVDLNTLVLPSSIMSEFKDLSFYFDDPVADPAAITMYRLALASPTKVLLSGVGVEEFFASYPRHSVLKLARSFSNQNSNIRALLGYLSKTLYGGKPGPLYSKRRNIQKLLRSVSDYRTPFYWRLMSQLTYSELYKLMPDYAAAAFDELDSMTTPLGSTSLADALEFDQSQFLPNLNLAYVDKASMAAGIEIRVPFLDETFINIAKSGNPNDLIVNGITKAPLRNAAKYSVPNEIIDRSKSGFGGPVRSWVKELTKSEILEKVNSITNTELVAKDTVLKLFKNANSGQLDSSLAIWSLVCLEAWHSTHITNDGI
jgi:asparagine synthase (glutamine-hydrolysing)